MDQHVRETANSGEWAGCWARGQVHTRVLSLVFAARVSDADAGAVPSPIDDIDQPCPQSPPPQAGARREQRRSGGINIIHGSRIDEE
jgi:hypothetical protein